MNANRIIAEAMGYKQHPTLPDQYYFNESHKTLPDFTTPEHYMKLMEWMRPHWFEFIEWLSATGGVLRWFTSNIRAQITLIAEWLEANREGEV